MDPLLLRQRQKAEAAKAAEAAKSTGGDKSLFPYKKMPNGSKTIVRFVQNGSDPINPDFWEERLTIYLPFKGIVSGGSVQTDADQTVAVPCIEMYGLTCPVLTQVKSWYKHKTRSDEYASKYYKKRSYLYHGFVVSAPIEEENPPESAFRKFEFGVQIHKNIIPIIDDTEIKYSVTDFEHGIDFTIVKTSNGKDAYPSYVTSTWGKQRERPLNDIELASIHDENGNLNIPEIINYLPPKPSQEAIDVIKAMFEASINDEPFDSDSFGTYFRPFGGGSASSDEEPKQSGTRGTSSAIQALKNKSASVVKEVPVVSEDEPSVVEDSSDDTIPEVSEAPAKRDPKDILAKMRAKALVQGAA